MRKFIFGFCLFILFICVTALLIWSLPKILPQSDRMTEVDLYKLLVTVDDFPPGWQADGIPEPVRGDELDWGDNNIITSFQPIHFQGYANQYIFIFRNDASAIYSLFWIKQQGFLTPPKDEPSPNWRYRSIIADDWIFGCSLDKTCVLLARYDEIIISFMTSINSEYMNLDDLDHLLRIMDEKVIRHLEK